MKINILFILLIFSVNSFSQKDTTFYSGDTAKIYDYYANGNIWKFEKRIKGRDWLSYENFTYYFENGNVEWSSFYDSKIDSSYKIEYYKNGNIKYKSLGSNSIWKRIYYNKKGIVKEIHSNDGLNKNYYNIDFYKKGEKIKTRKEYYSSSNKKLLDTIVYYQNDTIKNQQIFIELETDIDTSYTVNNLEFSKTEYDYVKNKYDKYLLSRSKKHWYQEYTSDSILILEGLFSDLDKCIGVFKEYYLDGVVKVRGTYDKNGRKDGMWTYYRNDGRYYMKVFYIKGEYEGGHKIKY